MTIKIKSKRLKPIFPKYHPLKILDKQLNLYLFYRSIM